jgi:lipopolysaccharide biosynthesis glycosyltransferase
MLQSLWEHNPAPSLSVFLIVDHVDAATLAATVSHLHQLLPSLSILRASAEPLLGFPVSGHATIATYFRLLLPSLLPQSVERVLFIDSDTTVTASLTPLWNLDLQGKALAAVPEHRISCLDHGYNYPDYFNAGVMVADLTRWRESNLLERGRQYAIEHPDRLRHWDQDILNHVFKGDWLPLEDRWNACPHLFGLNADYDLSRESLNESESEAIANPAIVHFAGPGPIKPWNARCRHPLKDRYLQAKKQTPWASTPLDDLPLPAWKQKFDNTVFQTKCILRRCFAKKLD